MSIAGGPTLSVSPGFVRLARAQTPPATATPATGTTSSPAGTTPQATEPPKTDAAPQPSPEEVEAAKKHFESGADFFQSGNYSAARLEFEASYALTKYPQLLFNLAKTEEKLGHIPEAIRYLEKYLASNPPDSDAEEVRTKLAALRQLPGASASPTPPALPPASSQPPPGKIPPIGALVLLGAGAGLLIVGIGLGGGALSAAGEFTPGSTVPYSRYAEGKALDAAGIAFDVIGGAALAAGVAWTGYWAYQRSKASKQPAPPPAAVSLAPVGLGLGITGRF